MEIRNQVSCMRPDGLPSPSTMSLPFFCSPSSGLQGAWPSPVGTEIPYKETHPGEHGPSPGCARLGSPLHTPTSVFFQRGPTQTLEADRILALIPFQIWGEIQVGLCMKALSVYILVIYKIKHITQIFHLLVQTATQ